MNVRTGLETFLENTPSWVRGRRLGLLCNQASVDTLLRHSKDLIFSTMLPGQLKCLFSPQHGLYAEKQDNMKESPDDFAQTLNIPVFSLYGKDREPSPDQLSGIDLLVVDLQDIGCRVYTFIWTLYLAMKACAKAGVGIAVLDRPNPLGGEVIEGNLLARDCRSFVGLAPLPMRHGMTIGEIAGFFMEERFCSVGLQLCAEVGGSAVLPHDGVMDGLAGFTIPNYRGFALVGDSDGLDILAVNPGVVHCLVRGFLLRFPNL